ncbi:MAG: ABC transporter permease, partial [Bacteroidota bacterium]
VLGASLSNLIQLFSWDFVKLLIVALVIASPIAWYFMQDWLSGFAYRISVQWWVFLLAGFGAGALTLLIISFQSLRAGLANPVEALRRE